MKRVFKQSYWVMYLTLFSAVFLPFMGLANGSEENASFERVLTMYLIFPLPLFLIMLKFWRTIIVEDDGFIITGFYTKKREIRWDEIEDFKVIPKSHSVIDFHIKPFDGKTVKFSDMSFRQSEKLVGIFLLHHEDFEKKNSQPSIIERDHYRVGDL